MKNALPTSMFSNAKKKSIFTLKGDRERQGDFISFWS